MTEVNIRNRTICKGDNLNFLRGINSACIDLIYLDPPFNKKKKFVSPGGAKKGAFNDMFRKKDIKEKWLQSIRDHHDDLHTLLEAVKDIEGGASYNFCYLAYMAIKLLECKRILKDAGSIYLHCDQTMSHYLKLAMDCIFGEKNFRNEIVWCYAGGGIPKNDFPNKFDVILRYTKTGEYTFNTQYREYGAHIKSGGRATDLGGKRKLDYNPKGTPINNWWTDIKPIINWHKERTEYPTQKPLKLLERIIRASTDEGDWVLDPFCGCATTPVAAEKLKRRWIGMDKFKDTHGIVVDRITDIQWKLIKDDDDAEQGEESGKDVDGRAYEKIDWGEEIEKMIIPPQRTDGGVAAELKEPKFVYVISNPAHRGKYKVGFCLDKDKNLLGYQRTDPERAYKYEYLRLTSRYKELETFIHKKFNAAHEWVTGDLRDIIKAIKDWKD